MGKPTHTTHTKHKAATPHARQVAAMIKRVPKDAKAGAPSAGGAGRG